MNKFIKLISSEVKDFSLTKIPLIVKSKCYSLHLDKEYVDTECIYNRGKYFG